MASVAADARRDRRERPLPRRRHDARARRAHPDDGLFDLVLVGDVSKLDFVTTSPKLYSGGHIGHPRIEVVQSPWVTRRGRQIRSWLELDGEQAGPTPVRFEVVPGALRLRVPRLGAGCGFGQAPAAAARGAGAAGARLPGARLGAFSSALEAFLDRLEPRLDRVERCAGVALRAP